MTNRAEPTDTPQLATRFDLSEFNDDLARDVVGSLRGAIDQGAVFAGTADPTALVRATLTASVQEIETHPDGQLLQRLIEVGPFDDGGGPLPDHLQGKQLDDRELDRAVAYVHSFMVNAFKGGLAELLAAGPCAEIVAGRRKHGSVPASARLFVGDAVGALTRTTRRMAKGADFHILSPDADGGVRICGVAEVKSYHVRAARLERQLDRHVARASEGIAIGGRVHDRNGIRVGARGDAPPLRISVTPARWKLSREFSIVGGELDLPETRCPVTADSVVEIEPGRWHVTLRWSQEALAAVALDMTFWYMGEVGRVLYRRAPRGWAEMSDDEAGRNAIKATLYYALRRTSPGSRSDQRAIALYNAYCFGYSLGMNFVDATRRRRMLWCEDLHEIAGTGRTRKGYRIRGRGRRRP